MKITIAIFAFLIGFTGSILAQQDSVRALEPAPTVVLDSTQKHSPRRAALLSTILPGAGQIYNRSYWKVPVIYAGFGVLIYLNRSYNTLYDKYSGAYNHYRQPYLDNGITTVPETGLITIDGAQYSPSSVMAARDQVRKYRDLAFMGACILYLMNIVDASVDAYFYDYDMSDNLALHIEPQPLVIGNQSGMMVTCRFTLK